MHCQQGEGEREGATMSLWDTNPPADADTRERRRRMDAASITAMVTSCWCEDRGWRATGLWSMVAGGWWWWGGHTSQLQPQHTLTTSHRGIRGGESFHNGRSICYFDHSLIIFNILSPPLIITKNNFDLKISKWPKCHQKKSTDDLPLTTQIIWQWNGNRNDEWQCCIQHNT